MMSVTAWCCLPGRCNFFKWIKQHLRIQRFLGTSENAVKTQIWCAISTYVLIAIVKKELQLDVLLYTCSTALVGLGFRKNRAVMRLAGRSNTTYQLNLFEI